ncbi:MAG: TonB-dependent receptor [Pseudomonadota bacterium]
MSDYRSAAFAACALLLCCAASAEEVLDEIIVRGDFRERALPDVPASIAVLNSATIREAAVQHFEELSALVPNLNFAAGSNRARYFQLRGIGERSQYEGAPNPSVGFIIDDVDFSGIGGAAMTWDVERIEVLRGPQATRYGANALAGLIFVQSVAPTDTFDARAQVSVGNDAFSSAAVAFGGPMTDKLGYRVALQRSSSDGFRNNVFLGSDDSNGREELTARGRLRWQPTDATTVDTTLLWVDQDNGYDAFAVDNGFTTYSNRPGRDAQRSGALGVRAVHAVDDRYVLTSITGVATTDVEFSFDADWGNQAYWLDFFQPPADAPFAADYDFFSRRDRQRDTINQEFRVQSANETRLFGGSTDWLFGVYGLRLTEDLVTTDDGIFSDGTFPGVLEVTTGNSEYTSTKMAVFGQLDTYVNDRTSVSVGLRVERRDADYSDSSGLSLSPGETAIGGHLSATYAHTDYVTSYAALSRGYKMGGFNLGNVPDGRREFDAEFLWNLEYGLRWQHERGALSATAFYARREDQQVDTSFQIVPNDPSTFVFFQDNAASGDNLGLELEATYQLDSHWSLYANVGLLDVTFDEFVTDGVDLSGREQAHAPRYSGAIGARFETESGLFARLDVTAKDAFFFSNSHDERSDAYQLVNLSLGLTRGAWQYRLWGRNLTDERYAVRGFFFGNEPPDFPDTQYVRLGDRRQFGISIDWQYGG